MWRLKVSLYPTAVLAKLHQPGRWAIFFMLLLYALEEDKENRDWFATAKEKNNEMTRSIEDYTGPRHCSS